MTNLHDDRSVANESETEDWQHRDIAMADLEHRLSSAEAELRETAGELEKATALLAQPCPWCLCTRAPAQPAAPTHDHEPNQDCAMLGCPGIYAEPVAPEPCAGQGVGFEQLWEGWRSKALSAEAQLAAVRDIINDIPESVFTAAEQGMLDEGDATEAVGDLLIIRALLTPAPSPGAGEKT